MPVNQETLGGIPLQRIVEVFEAECSSYVSLHPRSLALAGHGIAGFYQGVPMHWMRDWSMPFPFLVESAHGAVLHDVDGNEYADFCLGDTGAMLGHSPPPVVEAIERQAGRGLTCMLPTEDAIAVGRLLEERFGLPHWQVATTATDANRFALRVARAVTGRPKILVFNGCYHGTVDETFVRLVDGCAVNRSGLLGQVADLTQLARVVEFNDLAALRAALAHDDVACVIAEPVMTNSCMVLPEPGFHAELRRLTREAGTLLLIERLTKPFLLQHATCSGSAELADILAAGRESSLRDLLKEQQLVDVLRRYPAAWQPDALVRALRPLAPRLYSIASSAAAVGEEAHLTVAVVDYQRDGERRLGAASVHLAGLTGDAATVRVFIEPNERFRLPDDPSRDVIMIGPGTGVAPYRGFLQEREAQGATGRHWLVFGARHFDSEFLYQVEWQDAARKGLLQRVDLAFSRDRTPRAYVQDRLREAGAEVYAWLQGGAHLYVCGDAERMAPDVHAALVEIVAQHGGLGEEAAEAYLRRLADERRYLRDVY